MIKSWGPSGTTATQEKLSKIVALINFTWTMNKKQNNDVFTWEVPQKTVTAARQTHLLLLQIRSNVLLLL